MSDVSGCTMLSVLLLLLLLLPLSSALGSTLCPGPCLCYESSDLVDCRSRELVRIPPSIPHGAWLLDLSRNRMTEVHSMSFVGLWSLKILLMSNNSIQTLQPQSLSSLHFLERLDLSFNRLRWLPPDFSHSLSSIKELQLDHNLLLRLYSTTLAGFENLRKLDLSYNRIHVMDLGAFSGLFRLRVLNLEGNRLNGLRDGVLSRQQSLEVLLLGHNNISWIETEALAPLRSLSKLGLQGNQLERIKFKTFLKLQTTTTHIHMSSNPWACDCDLQRVFSKILRVRHLHVGDYDDMTCRTPAQHAGSSLSSLDSRLCFVETASVLLITATVLLALAGALFKAEQNRKNKQAASDAEGSESERQQK